MKIRTIKRFCGKQAARKLVSLRFIARSAFRAGDVRTLLRTGADIRRLENSISRQPRPRVCGTGIPAPRHGWRYEKGQLVRRSA